MNEDLRFVAGSDGRETCLAIDRDTGTSWLMTTTGFLALDGIHPEGRYVTRMATLGA